MAIVAIMAVRATAGANYCYFWGSSGSIRWWGLVFADDMPLTKQPVMFNASVATTAFEVDLSTLSIYS